MDLSPGAPFPDLRLPDHAGYDRSLSELVAGDPVVVQTYRGWWCPKEQAFFRRLIAFQDEVEVSYSRIVSISVDPPPVTAAFRAGLGARWTFLCDPDRTALELLGLRETTDTVNHPYVPGGRSRCVPDLHDRDARTTATGSGGARRSRSCAGTCAPSPAPCAPTGTAPTP